MKMIFFGDAARDSGNFGFSEACPLCRCQLCQIQKQSESSPSCPNRMDVHSLSDIDNQLHVCVIVVVRPARDLCAKDQHLLLPCETFWRQGELLTSTY